ncbi:MAG: SEL1-like repeat protein [Candidatus Paracaedibacteraceae bacterium]|nr:SEL1-like repeat protein [Candidatus Paracaedibacteraceae bacterium]
MVSKLIYTFLLSTFVIKIINNSYAQETIRWQDRLLGWQDPEEEIVETPSNKASIKMQNVTDEEEDFYPHSIRMFNKQAKTLPFPFDDFSNELKIKILSILKIEKLIEARTVSKDFKSLIDNTFVIKAKSNPLEEHFIFGWMFQNGIGVKRDGARALAAYKEAAKGQHPNALYKLGLYFSQKCSYTLLTLGRPLEKNLENVKNAKKYFTQASEKKHHKAQYELACILQEEAYKAYQASGQTYSTNDFSWDELNGYGIWRNPYYNAADRQKEINLRKALQKVRDLYLSAAYGRVVSAMLALAKLYGGQTASYFLDENSSLRWYEEAAANGSQEALECLKNHPSAQAALKVALLYLSGRGIDDNYDLSIQYFLQAAYRHNMTAWAFLKESGASKDPLALEAFRKIITSEMELNKKIYRFCQQHSNRPTLLIENHKAIFVSGKEWEEKGNFKEAINAYSQIIEYAPACERLYRLAYPFAFEEESSEPIIKYPHLQAEAQFQYGEYYCTKMGLGNNQERALCYFLDAFKNGHREAAYKAGMIYLKREESSNSLSYFEKAAKQGHVEAKYELSKLWLDEDLRGDDYIDDARKLLESLIIEGHEKAKELYEKEFHKNSDRW